MQGSNKKNNSIPPVPQQYNNSSYSFNRQNKLSYINEIYASFYKGVSERYDLFPELKDSHVEKNYPDTKLDSISFLLRAQCHEANENKLGAIENYTKCIEKDPTCIEAFNRLVDCYLMTSQEKENLLTQLNFDPEDVWIRKYYTSRIKNDQLDDCKIQMKNSDFTEPGIQICPYIQYPTTSSTQKKMKAGSNINEKMQEELSHKAVNSENVFEILNQKDNIDILCIKAKNAHQNYDIQLAYDICVKAIKKDPLYFTIIPIYCACLLDLNYIGELYYCAHNLIENYSNHPLSWFAIGTYYYLTKKYEISRKYFQKAIQIDRNFIYAWIGMAHSFAIQDESDQAMSVYRTVSRIFPGCYLAYNYMGMEYLRTNNLKTAKLLFQQAKQINSQDPLTYNEIGIIYFKQKMYDEAKNQYQQALTLCQEQGSVDWIIETILNNLAHAYRKLRLYKEAIQTYEQCVTLNPKNPNTYFSIAYTYHISNQINKAISYYHKSLHYKHDNQFAQDMLSRCLTDAIDLPFNNVCNV